MSLAKEAAQIAHDVVAARLRNVAGKSPNKVTSALAHMRAKEHQGIYDMFKNPGLDAQTHEKKFHELIGQQEKAESFASAARQARSDNPVAGLLGKLRLRLKGVPT